MYSLVSSSKQPQHAISVSCGRVLKRAYAGEVLRGVLRLSENADCAHIVCFHNILVYKVQFTYCYRNRQFYKFRNSPAISPNTESRSNQLSFTSQSSSHLSVWVCQPIEWPPHQEQKTHQHCQMLEKLKILWLAGRMPLRRLHDT